MLIPKEIQDSEPRWKNVKAGDFLLMEYKKPHLCYAHIQDNGLNLVSLTDSSIYWTSIQDWDDTCSNKLLQIYQSGDTFAIK